MHLQSCYLNHTRELKGNKTESAGRHIHNSNSYVPPSHWKTTNAKALCRGTFLIPLTPHNLKQFTNLSLYNLVIKSI